VKSLVKPFGNVKAVLFDLDETLIDAPLGLKIAHRAVARKLRRYLVQRNISMDEQTLRAKIRALDDRMNFEIEYDRDAWWPVLLRELGLKPEIPDSLVRELTRCYWSAYEAAAEPYPDAEPTLAHLKRNGYKLALVTDTDGIRGAKRRRAERLGLARFFNAIVVGGEDTPRAKPSPDSFLLAAEKLHVLPSECAVVGDKPFTDVRGARAAGMLAILLKRRDWGVVEKPDAVIRSLSELKRLFTRKARRSRGSAPSARRARQARAPAAAGRLWHRSSM